MRGARTEHVLLGALLLVPLAVAFIGWPVFVRWVVGPTPEPTPEVAGAEATSVAVAQVARPTVRPTVGAPATIAPRATVARAAPAATPVPAATAEVQAAAPQPAAPAPQVGRGQTAATPNGSTEDPSAAVQDFYARVAQHDFGAAAALWSPRMRAAFPPAQNIDGRFSQTQAVTVRNARVVSSDPSAGRAAVAVDLVEQTSSGPREWVGTWYLVRGPGGWLLDQPALQPD
jgi:hypothetical protein